MRSFKVGFVGTGGRSVCYGRAYAGAPDVDVVAVADPSTEHRELMIRRSGLRPEPEQFDDWQVMLRAHAELDGVVISTPNYCHAEQAIACYELGLPIALEKPVATTKEDCERIVSAERANNGRSLIGFVLRSTPFYSKIHELISDGAIGRVTSIQADELPGLSVSSIMSRSPWRRYHETSGGALLEKCCHDMDILNWMMGCNPVSLNSYGGSLIFRPDPALPETCDRCPKAGTCPYYRRPRRSAHEDEGEDILHQFIREDHVCIYNIDKDIVDTQSVNIEYETGAVVNFLMNFHGLGERASRNFHAAGTEGRIWGNLHDKTVYLFDNAKGEVTGYDASGDGSGHGGGDILHALELRKMMLDPDYRPGQDAYAGYLSAAMCFAADVSRIDRRRVDLQYAEDGFVDIV